MARVSECGTLEASTYSAYASAISVATTSQLESADDLAMTDKMASSTS
jgi:hypothetical protein